jgi:hypothetical protein
VLSAAIHIEAACPTLPRAAAADLITAFFSRNCDLKSGLLAAEGLPA